jgi:small subunit ribosomal protein S5
MNPVRPLYRSFASTRLCSSQQITRRCLHSSRKLQQDDHNELPPVSPKGLGLSKKEKSLEIKNAKRKSREDEYPAYTEAEFEELKEKYTPEQIAAIRAGEAAVDPKDLSTQAVLNQGPMSLKYIDDFSKIRAVIDKAPKAPEGNHDTKLRFKSSYELAADIGDWIDRLPEDPDPSEWTKFVDTTRLTIGKAEAETNPRSSEAPAIGPISDPLVRATARASKAAHNQEEAMQAHYERLEKITGMPIAMMKSLRTKHLLIRRVVNQTRMGKIPSMYFLTVVGNKNGLVGLGEGKADEPEDARVQSLLNAIRNLRPILRYEERTIFGNVKGKSGATELELFTRPPGNFI